MVLVLVLPGGLSVVPGTGTAAEAAGTPVVEMDARLPTPLSSPAAVWTGQYAYVFGGLRPEAGEIFDDRIFRYDVEADIIQEMPTRLPGGRDLAATVWTGTHALIIGGRLSNVGYTNQILRYDPSTDQIEMMGATLPDGRAALAAVWTGTSVFIFGGIRPDGTVPRYTDEILRYDPASDTLTTLTVKLPFARSHTAAFWDSTYAYVVGGYTGGEPRVSEIVRFDPSTLEVRTQSTGIQPGRSSPAAAWDGVGKAYVLGGYASSPLDEIMRYEPASDTVTSLSGENIRLPTTLYGMAAVWAGEATLPSAYLFGGVGPTGYSDRIVRFTPTDAGRPVSLSLPDRLLEKVPSTNTLGFTTSSDTLDSAFRLEAQQFVRFNISIGEMDAYSHFRDSRCYGFGFDAKLTLPPSFLPPPAGMDVAQVFLNDHLVGTIQLHLLAPKVFAFLASSGDACDDASDGRQPIGPAFQVPAGVVKSELNAVEVRPVPVTVPGAGDVLLNVRAGAIELAAPPMFILHGFTPIKDNSEECPSVKWSQLLNPRTATVALVKNLVGSSSLGEDRPNSKSVTFQARLKTYFESEATKAFGQNPWNYTIAHGAPGSQDDDPGLNPHWVYCGKVAYPVIATHFANRIQELETQGGYEGPVWVTAHSMGGLVTRWATEARPEGSAPSTGAPHVTRLITMGTPHEGTCAASISGGPAWAISPLSTHTWWGDSDDVADWAMRPSSKLLKSLNAEPNLEPSIRYLALSGQLPISSLLGLCAPGAFGDGVVPVTSSRFDGRSSHPNYEVRMENCTPHSTGIPSVSKEHKPYYDDEDQSQPQMMAWLFRPYIQEPPVLRSLDDCHQTPFVRGANRYFVTPVRDAPGNVVDFTEEVIDTTRDIGVRTGKAVVDGAKGAVRGGRDAVCDWTVWCEQGLWLRGRGVVASAAAAGFAAEEGSDGARSVMFSGGNVTLSLLTGVGETRLGLELTAPDGTLVREGDELPWIIRDNITTDNAEVRHWFLLRPTLGTWTLRIVGPAEAEETLPFLLFVREEGPSSLRISSDHDAYHVGEAARITAAFDDTTGATDLAMTATVESSSGVRTLEMVPRPDGSFDVVVPILDSDLHSVSVRATGLPQDGAPFERRATLDVRVLKRIDWELSDLRVEPANAWRGEPIQASARVCSVGDEVPQGRAQLVFDHGSKRAAFGDFELAPGDLCSDVEASWSALVADRDAIQTAIVSLMPQTSVANDAAEAPHRVYPAPFTTASLTGATGAEGWFVSSVEVALAPYDGSDAALPIRYALDDSPSEPYEGPFAVEEGDHALRFGASDPATSEVEPTRLARVPVDLTPPRTRHVLAGPVHQEGEALFIGPATSLDLVAADATSGVAFTEGGEPGSITMHTRPVSLSGDSRVTGFLARSTDVAGNVEPIRELALRFDADPPRSSLAVGEPRVEQDVPILTSTTPIELVGDDPVVNDVASGLALLERRVSRSADRGASWTLVEDWTPTSEPFHLEGPDGLYAIEHRGTDNVANVEAPGRVVVGLDNTPPSTMTLVGEPLVEDTFLFVTSNTPLEVQGEDPVVNGVASGLAGMQRRTSYSPDLGASWQVVSDWAPTVGPFLLAGPDGLYALDHAGTDLLGNAEAPRTKHLYLDNTAPDLALQPGAPFAQEGAGPVVPPEALNAVLSTDPPVGGAASGVHATDAEAQRLTGSPAAEGFPSGVESVEFRLAGDDGRYEVLAHTRDRLGNARDASFPVAVDATRPLAEVVSPGPGDVCVGPHAPAAPQPPLPSQPELPDEIPTVPELPGLPAPPAPPTVPDPVASTCTGTADRDADGFPDQVEALADSDPGRSLSTPATRNVAGNPAFEHGLQAWQTVGALEWVAVDENGPWRGLPEDAQGGARGALREAIEDAWGGGAGDAVEGAERAMNDELRQRFGRLWPALLEPRVRQVDQLLHDTLGDTPHAHPGEAADGATDWLFGRVSQPADPEAWSAEARGEGAGILRQGLAPSFAEATTCGPVGVAFDLLPDPRLEAIEVTLRGWTLDGAPVALAMALGPADWQARQWSRIEVAAMHRGGAPVTLAMCLGEVALELRAAASVSPLDSAGARLDNVMVYVAVELPTNPLGQAPDLPEPPAAPGLPSVPDPAPLTPPAEAELRLLRAPRPAVVQGVVEVRVAAQDPVVWSAASGLGCVVLEAVDPDGLRAAWNTCDDTLLPVAGGGFGAAWDTADFDCAVELRVRVTDGVEQRLAQTQTVFVVPAEPPPAEEARGCVEALAAGPLPPLAPGVPGREEACRLVLSPGTCEQLASDQVYAEPLMLDPADACRLVLAASVCDQLLPTYPGPSSRIHPPQEV